MGLKAPRISKTTLYLSGEGDGSTLSIQGGSDVSVDFYQNLKMSLNEFATNTSEQTSLLNRVKPS
jgi:hypothetical protein